MQRQDGFIWSFIPSPEPSEEGFKVNSKTEPSVLCFICSRFREYIEGSLESHTSSHQNLVFEHLDHSDPIAQLVSSARAGCHLCSLILSYIEDQVSAFTTLKDVVIYLILQWNPVHMQFLVLPALIAKIGDWLPKAKSMDLYSMHGSLLTIQTEKGLC
jgi:hypothetical protein